MSDTDQDFWYAPEDTPTTEDLDYTLPTDAVQTWDELHDE